MHSKSVPIARPAATSCFLIPAIDPEIPGRFSKDASRSQLLARFSKAATAVGIALPEGDFLNIEEVVKAQWLQHLQRSYPADAFRGAVGLPVIRVTDDRLQVVIGAASNLDVYQLKPVVTALEAMQAGLGWYVHSVLDMATHHAHEMYGMAQVPYMLHAALYDLEEFSDEAYARSLIMDQGDYPPEGPIPQETMEQLRQDYGYWPSDLLKDVDGHAHLLGGPSAPGSKPPKRLTIRQARNWLRGNPGASHAEVVQAALDLETACKRDADRTFLWHGSRVMSHDAYDEDEDPMGAMCFIAWEDPELLMEAVSHFEQNQYNGGQAVEAFARTTLFLEDNQTTDADLRKVAKATADYFNRWALLSRLLSHFPVWNNDDET